MYHGNTYSIFEYDCMFYTYMSLYGMNLDMYDEYVYCISMTD